MMQLGPASRDDPTSKTFQPLLFAFALRAAYWATRDHAPGLALLRKAKRSSANQLLDARPPRDPARALVHVAAQALRPDVVSIVEAHGCALAGPEDLEAEIAAAGELLDAVREPVERLRAGVPEAFRCRTPPAAATLQPPRVVVISTIDEWPKTAAFDEWLAIDPRMRALPTWFHDKACPDPRVLSTLPEDSSDADFRGLMALVRHLSQVLRAEPHAYLAASRTKLASAYGAHASASLEQLIAHFEARGWHVLGAKDVIRSSEAWHASFTHAAARPEPGPWSYPKQTHDPLDHVRPQLADDPSRRTQQLVELAHAARRFRGHGTDWALHLGAAIRDSADFRDALRDSGFTRGQLAFLNADLERILRDAKHVEPRVQMECAPWRNFAPVDAELEARVQDALMEGFPTRIGRFVLDIDDVDEAMRARIDYLDVRDQGRQVRRGTAKLRLARDWELASPELRSILAARLERMRAASDLAIEALFAHAWSDLLLEPPRPVPASLRAVVDAHLPLTVGASEVCFRHLIVDGEGDLRVLVRQLARASAETRARIVHVHERSVVLLEAEAVAADDVVALERALTDPRRRSGLGDPERPLDPLLVEG